MVLVESKIIRQSDGLSIPQRDYVHCPIGVRKSHGVVGLFCPRRLLQALSRVRIFLHIIMSTDTHILVMCRNTKNWIDRDHDHEHIFLGEDSEPQRLAFVHYVVSYDV